METTERDLYDTYKRYLPANLIDEKNRDKWNNILLIIQPEPSNTYMDQLMLSVLFHSGFLLYWYGSSTMIHTVLCPFAFIWTAWIMFTKCKKEMQRVSLWDNR